MEAGFNIKLVLADSLYGESSQFIRKIAEDNLGYVVSISLSSWSLATSRTKR